MSVVSDLMIVLFFSDQWDVLCRHVRMYDVQFECHFDSSFISFQAAETFLNLYNNVFMKYDSTMLEINPMAEDSHGNGEC